MSARERPVGPLGWPRPRPGTRDRGPAACGGMPEVSRAMGPAAVVAAGPGAGPGDGRCGREWTIGVVGRTAATCAATGTDRGGRLAGLASRGSTGGRLHGVDRHGELDAFDE